MNWEDGDECVVVPSISTDEARTKFPKGVTEIKPYRPMSPQTNRNGLGLPGRAVPHPPP